MKEETVKVKEAYRRFLQAAELEFERAEDGSVKSMTFSASSETPYERWFGTEILVHEADTVRMDRAAGGAMPLLFNHDMNKPLGMIEKAWLSNGRMMVKAKPFAIERMQEVQTMIDGGLRNVSVAYRIHKIEEAKTGNDSGTFRVTDWEPFEVSIVTVPADPTVGIGREYEVRMVRQEHEPALQPAEAQTVVHLELDGRTLAEAITTRRADMEPKDGAAPAGSTTVESNGKGKELSGVEMEQRRIKAIKNLCKMNQLDEKYEAMFVGRGYSVEDCSEEILKVIETRGQNNPQSVAKIGLGTKETKEYSFLRAIQAIVKQDWTQAPFELECNRAIADKLRRAPEPHKFLVPFEVLERGVPFIPRSARERMQMQRDLSLASNGAGGYLRETSNMGFIDLLRARAVCFRMGARPLSGLVGNVTIPRLSAAGTMYWLASEIDIATESNQTFEQVSLSPNNAAAYTEISRQLLLQSSPGAEDIVTNDLSTIVALGADKAAIQGTGTEQPQGVIGTSGVGDVTGPTLNYDSVLEHQVDVATAEVQPMSGGYVTTAAVAKLGMIRTKFDNTATPLWEGNLWDGTMAGFPCMSSSQVPSATIVFGDWAEMLIAEWGVLEVDVNPYANFQAGIIGVRCMYSMDVGIRRPAAFTKMDNVV